MILPLNRTYVKKVYERERETTVLRLFRGHNEKLYQGDGLLLPHKVAT